MHEARVLLADLIMSAPRWIIRPRFQVNEGNAILEGTKERTGKESPNNGCLVHKVDLVHHDSAPLVDESSVQRRVLHENEFQSHRVWGQCPARWVADDEDTGPGE